jgi:hypothetical protein
MPLALTPAIRMDFGAGWAPRMDCSLLIGQQLDALGDLARSLAEPGRMDAAGHVLYRELRDRASAHCQVREQIVLPVLQRSRWKGLTSEALAAHMDLKRALAALCIIGPAEPDFPRMLALFQDAVAQQRLADDLWLMPSLRQVSTVEQRRLMCVEIERLQESLIPPADHYLITGVEGKLGAGLVEDAAVVLGLLGSEPRGPAVGAS